MPSPPGNSSGADILGEDGESSEVERETEDGEAGDDCPSDTENLGKLEVGMVTLSFEPTKQAADSKKKKFELSKKNCYVKAKKLQKLKKKKS